MSYKLISWCPHDKYHPSLSVSKLILIVQSYTESAADPVHELGTLTSKMGALPFKCKDDARACWQQDVTWWLLFSLDDEALYNQQHSMTQSFIHSFIHPLCSASTRGKQNQFSSVSRSCLTLHKPMDHRTPGLPAHHQLLEFTQTHVHWVSDAIQPSYPLSSPSPPAFNLSQHQGLFKWVSSPHRWPKYWSFSLNISHSNEHPALIFFRMDWLDLLTVQGTLKSLL